MIRTTTNAVLSHYRYNLNRSSLTMNQARNTVLTQRNFNSFAEDPVMATQCFQLRRSFQRVNSQFSVGESVCRKYDIAWHTMDSVINDVSNRLHDSAYAQVIKGLNDPTASGRTSVGESLGELAKSIVQTMNARYGDNFVFAGADGLNVPFTWDEKTGGLCYRGIPVDSHVPEVEMQAGGNPPVPQEFNQDGTPLTPNGDVYYRQKDGTMISKADYETAEKNTAALDYMVREEKKFADLGLGLQEEQDGSLIKTSAVNVALQGIDFLGYGVDQDGDPKNVVSLIQRMSDILKDCDPDSGAFKNGEADAEELRRLAGKFEEAAGILTTRHTNLDTQKAFLDSNQLQLKENAYTLQQQFLGMEDVDMADAITSFVWGKYCYDTALKVGNSILSQSLMDYLNP